MYEKVGNLVCPHTHCVDLYTRSIKEATLYNKSIVRRDQKMQVRQQVVVWFTFAGPMYKSKVLFSTPLACKYKSIVSNWTASVNPRPGGGWSDR